MGSAKAGGDGHNWIGHNCIGGSVVGSVKADGDGEISAASKQRKKFERVEIAKRASSAGACSEHSYN